MSNAKVRHRRRWRRAHDRTYQLWMERMKKRGLWGFDRCETWRDEEGRVKVHILRGGFGYF